MQQQQSTSTAITTNTTVEEDVENEERILSVAKLEVIFVKLQRNF